MEKDGKFDLPIADQEIRNDRILWLSLSDIDKESFKNIYFICHMLTALPYELNTKTQLYANASELF